jgi:hypothetical protein
MSPNPIRQVHEVFFRSWPITEARVDSCSWVQDHDYMGVDAGHYDVVISYEPAKSGSDLTGRMDQLQHGHIRCSGNRQVAPHHPGERIPIRYSSKHPSHFHLADTSPNYEKLETILVMTLFALIAGYLLLTF